MANSAFLFWYNGLPITITTNTERPVTTTTDYTASTTATTLYAAPLTTSLEYKNATSYDAESNTIVYPTGRPTATETITGSYTVPIELILVPVTPTPTSNVSTSSVPGNTTSATTSSANSLSIPTPTVSASHASKSVAPGPIFHSGDIAGAAVACLVGGALIAGLLVWLIMSTRYKKQRPLAGFAQRREGSSNNNREKPLPTGPLMGGAAGAGWEQHLPQSESDSTIRTSVKALFDQIELHVENFYHNATVSMSPEMQAELMKIDSSYLSDSVVGLLPQTKTPTMLIKHCLAHLIVSHITPESETSASFLPVDFMALPRAMSGTRANNEKPAFAQAFSRWRVLSCYLRPRPKDDRAYLSVRDGNITLAADRFCSAFAPWATTVNDQESRRRNLIEIMKSASDTGIMIFSQPSGFSYRWAVPSERDRKGLIRIVVVPGFAKVSDEHARNLQGRGQELVAPVIGTL